MYIILRNFCFKVYIHIQGDDCALVEENDRLGIYSQTKTSVAYLFDNTVANSYRHVATTLPAEGDVISFIALRQPYEFSVAAWIDTSTCSIITH